MEEKTQIEEKRVKSNVIRRRKTIETAPVAEEVTPPVPVEAPIEVKPQAKEEVHPKVATKTGVVRSPVEVQKSVTENIVQTHAVQKAAPAVLPEAGKGKEGISQPAGATTQPKIEEKPKRVSMLGQIIALPKTPQQLAKMNQPLVPLVEEEEETEDGDKKNKIKKPVIKKKIGAKNEVVVEGIGRVASLTQLTRIVHTDRVERVFEPSKMGKRKKVISKKGHKKTLLTVTKASKRIVEMDKTISVSDLARQMDTKAGEVIKKLMGMGMMATVNQQLDSDTAILLAQEFGFEIKDISFKEEQILENVNRGVEERLEARPPIVTVMGHVDHGKTSLLDAIRQTNVTGGEFGGITQHIGAYTVNTPKGKVTFLDTPGHEAFTSMRARGAAVTDVVILVVAADDGVMPQTRESIDHAKAAGVPVVVAVNKIDKPSADLERIKRQLSELELVPEDWGGHTMFMPVSAKTKTGIQELLEAVLLQAEVLELKADPYVKANGVVIEAKLDKSRGPVSTLLISQGTLHVGDPIVAGCYAGKVRAMVDDKGQPVKEAGPSYAVEIIGLEGVPAASESFNVTADDQTAALVAQNRLDEKKKIKMAKNSKVSLEDFFAQSAAGELKELNIILKTDVHGSLEALREALIKLATDKVKVRVIHDGVGGINESDVILAQASKAIILGFNVRPETKALGVAESENVDIKVYKIIYEMLNDVKLAMRGLLTPTKKEKYLGRAEIRQTFTVSQIGTVAGCYVIDGKIVRGAHLRLLRDNVIIHEGRISTLKRIKDDAKEVTQGFECGMSIEGYQDVKQGDVVEAFDVELIQPEL
ncbi:MAG: hypothetical protein ACD_73C00788G0002 [uncultured bacterium]|nr:MAG: hypothetical protein ACD_73C00788G0002 [uncultured bacterium]